ncbi:MAG: hypothetical protein U5K79_05875 [Cyclobacteriaceae bacterium]|nr:hypothetical protein [Cyclobacteriaceae bacterium]
MMLILISLTINLVISVILYYVLKLEIHLYSLAGMTISLGMIIDNTIVMVDHYHHHKNLNVFLAILAATVTTIGALSMVFLLDEEQQINLYDFALVITVNLFVSLLIALFFIPALMDTIRLATRKKRALTKHKRTLIRATVFYGKSIRFCQEASLADDYCVFVLRIWLACTVAS